MLNVIRRSATYFWSGAERIRDKTGFSSSTGLHGVSGPVGRVHGRIERHLRRHVVSSNISLFIYQRKTHPSCKSAEAAYLNGLTTFLYAKDCLSRSYPFEFQISNFMLLLLFRGLCQKHARRRIFTAQGRNCNIFLEI